VRGVNTQLWTVAEAAGQLRISRTALYGLIAAGALPVVNVGTPRRSRSRIRDEDLAAFIESRTRLASAPPAS
jgi:excisionase family DNA binding protein